MLIVTDRILTPQKYLEIITGKYFALNEDDQLEEVENILNREFGEGSVWSYSLTDIPDEKHEVKLVPVEIVNITEDSK